MARKVVAMHLRKFTIADKQAVHVLLDKLEAPHGSRIVDQERLKHALDLARREYEHSHRKVRQAFFHGLLTGYAIGLKHT